MTICQPAGPLYLNFLNELMAIRSSSGFNHFRPGAFHIALQTHKTQHVQPKGWKKRRTKKHGLRLSPSARRGRFLTLSSILCFCELSWAYIRAKFLLSHQECWLILSCWPTRPLVPQVLAPPLAAAFLRLLLTALFYWLLWNLAFSCLFPVP